MPQRLSSGARLKKAAALVVSATTALALGAPPTQAANRQPEWRQFLFTRTTNAGSNLDIYVGTASSLNGKELTAVIPVYANRKGNVTGTDPGLLFASEGGGFPEAYAFGERVTCSDTGNPESVCDRTHTGGGRATGIFFEFPDGKAPTHVLAVAYGVKPSIEMAKTSDGWRVEQVPGPMISVRSARDSEAVGVYHRLTAGAELFLSAAADGGKGGSLVLAQPPCGYQPFFGFVNAGVGYSKLTGGDADRESVCPGVFLANEPGYYAMTSFARKRATWRLDGAVVGLTTSMAMTRLITVDITAALASALR